MPIITTKILGINEADPKPATQFNYAGLPMKPGDSYNGRPEHQAPSVISVSDTPVVRVTRKARRKPNFSPEVRAKFAARMRDWQAKRKAARQAQG